MRIPFWKFVIQYQTWTATTAGIDQARTRPGGEQNAHPRRDADEEERDQRAEADRERDVRGREDRGSQQRAPEDLVVQDGGVVVEPDPHALALDELG